MAFLIHLVCLLARHRFLVLPAFLLLAISGGGVSGRHKTGWRWLAGSLAFANFFGSPVLGAWLLYRVGETASAQVTGTFATWVNINDRDVVGYDVLIRQADGKVISTRFEDDEFTLFPPQNFALPAAGRNVRRALSARLPPRFRHPHRRHQRLGAPGSTATGSVSA